jgi:hypothetical protein
VWVANYGDYEKEEADYKFVGSEQLNQQKVFDWNAGLPGLEQALLEEKSYAKLKENYQKH